jgi:hypothetical protein
MHCRKSRSPERRAEAALEEQSQRIRRNAESRFSHHSKEMRALSRPISVPKRIFAPYSNAGLQSTVAPRLSVCPHHCADQSQIAARRLAVSHHQS